jgi:hypothetical protein
VSYLLVLTQTISSHLLYPHLLNNSRPSSKCEEPTQRNKKDGLSAISDIGIEAISSKVHD